MIEGVKDCMAVILTMQILELLKSAAPNETKARSALNGALALLPNLDLRQKPTSVIR